MLTAGLVAGSWGLMFEVDESPKFCCGELSMLPLLLLLLALTGTLLPVAGLPRRLLPELLTAPLPL